MLNWFCIAAGGALGALLRYGIGGLVQDQMDTLFPWGTLAANLLGCLFIGFLWETFQHVMVAGEWRYFLLVGLLGAFTTFSTYTLETITLAQDGEWKYAAGNLLISNVLGIFLALGGIFFARYLFQSS